MARESKLYHGNENETTCQPIEGADLAELLKEALGRIEGRITERELHTQEQGAEAAQKIPADPNIRNFSYGLVDGELHT